MDDNKTIEQYKAEELELKKQLEAAKAENQRLELEMKFKDKLTGLWNRKYLEKQITENALGADQPGFTIICADIDNLNLINSKFGADAGDTLIKNLAEGLQNSFGENAVCCKMVGTKMCAILTASEDELKEKLKAFDHLIQSPEIANSDAEISYGSANFETHPDIDHDINALLKEAEYDLLMHKVSKEETDPSAPSAPHKKRAAGDEISILMIDDSLVILRTLQMMLKDSYKILMTTSGMEGYEIAKSKHPDLILLDYKMPVVDGERVMNLLKKSNSTKDIPVIFVSGVSDREKILKVASLKPAGYLLKPVEKENLLNVVNTVLQS